MSQNNSPLWEVLRQASARAYVPLLPAGVPEAPGSAPPPVGWVDVTSDESDENPLSFSRIRAS
jgi:hypothetical protein